MTHPAILVTLGVFVGMVGSAIGVGGGFVVVPFLLIATSMIHPQAVATSLVVVVVTAAVGTAGFLRLGGLDRQTSFAFAAASVPGAVGGALVTLEVSGDVFRLLLGGVLLLAAVGLLITPRGEADRPRNLRSGWGILERTYATLGGETVPYRVNLRWGVVVSLGVGAIGGFFGIGGGVLYVPFMFLALGVPFRMAVPISTAVLLPQSAVALGVLALRGTMPQMPAVWLGAGALVGAVVGVSMTRRVTGYALRRVMAAVLAGVGAMMGLKYFGGL